MRFTMIYGPSGIGKESVARELAMKNNWHIFPQHLAFDVACAVVGFGNNGFEKYQRKICLDAFRAFFENKVDGVVFTYCYVHPASSFFLKGLFELLGEIGVKADYIRLSCNYDEHVRRVICPNRKNTNKIQSKGYLDDYLHRFNFTVDIPEVNTFKLDNTHMDIKASAIAIEKLILP